MYAYMCDECMCVFTCVCGSPKLMPDDFLWWLSLNVVAIEVSYGPKAS